ncbi:MAG: ankyrin repeat domain-containing protein, partial [Sedimenticolaceae bacterium]
VAVAEILLEAGADIHRRDDRGRDALMIAAGRGHRAMVSLLLERGADPAVRDHAGLTAADLASDDDMRLLLRD